MKVTMETGNYRVLDSGTVFTFDSDSSLEFNMDFNESFQFNLILKFERNNTKKRDIKTEINDNNIILTCVNFDSSLGTGTSKAIELATFNGKKVFFNFWVYSLNEKSNRKVSYSLYIEK